MAFESELEIYAAIIDAASATEGLVSDLAIHGNCRRAFAMGGGGGGWVVLRADRTGARSDSRQTCTHALGVQEWIALQTR